MKKLFKYILLYTFIAILIIAVALVAAPFFVRQEQVKNFIENHVALPDNQKLKLDGIIKFGIFPNMYAKVPTLSIIENDGNAKIFEHFHFGFNTTDLIKTGISFNTSFLFAGNEYEGRLTINDYQGLLDSGQSEILLKLEEPLPVKVKGFLIRNGDVYSLKDFKVTHKQTIATGNLKIGPDDTGLMQIDLNTEINSENIEDIRRLIEFGKNNDDFNLLSGSGKVKLSLTTKGSTEMEFKQNLNGEGDVSVHDAAIYGIDLNELIGAPQETQLTDNPDRKIDISEADTIFKITNGIVKIEELNASNQFANISGSGTVDIPQSLVKVGIDIDADIASAKVKIPLVVYGSFSKIKFAPRAGDMLLDNVENIVDGTSKIRFKDIKINLEKANIGKSVEKLRSIGKSFGIDLDKLTKGATKDVAPAPAPLPAPATPAPTQPAAPLEMPASMKK